MREVLTDFQIPFDDHKIGRRMALAQWMSEQLRIRTALGDVLRDCHSSWMDSPAVKKAQEVYERESPNDKLAP